MMANRLRVCSKEIAGSDISRPVPQRPLQSWGEVLSCQTRNPAEHARYPIHFVGGFDG
ncbi:hypothetical protein SAMN05444172_2324 [Burkholderia sp. GAS332]|nr:hypothetical protein SAMN05444172_2324 [Burkholderia sp. GAS332]